MRLGLIAAGLLTLVLLVGIGFATSNTSPAQQQVAAAPLSTGSSGLPLPRFVSLKADRVNARQGPSRTHAVRWVYSKQGLPVEIIAEYENWRQVRDSEGDESWVFHSLLSGRRTVLVMPWAKGPAVPMRDKPSDSAVVVAQIEPGVLGMVEVCDGRWCRLALADKHGWMPQESLWGVYSGEKFQ